MMQMGDGYLGNPNLKKIAEEIEWTPEERRVNRIVFIGRNLNREELEDGFKKCLT